MSKQLKRRMFDAGSKALSKVRTVDPGLYACPICLRLFESSSLDDGQLTVEHVPSKAIGGKPLVLTCRDCNSQLGHTVDAAANDRRVFENLLQAMAGNARHEGRVLATLNDIETVNADLIIDGGKYEFRIVDKINDPKKHKELQDALNSLASDGGWDGSKINVKAVRGFNYKLARMAFLKNAYLVAFASLGY